MAINLSFSLRNWSPTLKRPQFESRKKSWTCETIAKKFSSNAGGRERSEKNPFLFRWSWNFAIGMLIIHLRRLIKSVAETLVVSSELSLSERQARKGSKAKQTQRYFFCFSFNLQWFLFIINFLFDSFSSFHTLLMF